MTAPSKLNFPEHLEMYRCDRPDEWKMNEFIRLAEEQQATIHKLESKLMLYDPLHTRIVDGLNDCILLRDTELKTVKATIQKQEEAIRELVEGHRILCAWSEKYPKEDLIGYMVKIEMNRDLIRCENISAELVNKHGAKE